MFSCSWNVQRESRQLAAFYVEDRSETETIDTVLVYNISGVRNN